MSMISKKELKLIDEQNKKWFLSGKKLTHYKCNHCEYPIITLQPDKDDVDSKGYWDSARQCLRCGKLNFVTVFPSGRTKSTKIGD